MTKLPFTTGGWHRNTTKPSTNGVEGIMKSIQEFINNIRINGYIEDVVIQPFWQTNTEASVMCFNSVPMYRNKNKKNRKSGLNKANNEVCFDFARKVIEELKAVAPELIADGVLRIDFFGEILPDGTRNFIVNEVEGFEACDWGTGANAGDKSSFLYVQSVQYWKGIVDVMIECHIERQRNERLRQRR